MVKEPQNAPRNPPKNNSVKRAARLETVVSSERN
jgi:hypothetical protein